MVWGLIVTVVLSAALLALSELLASKDQGEEIRPKGLGDFQFPTAQEGRVVPIVWGTVKLKGPNVVWYGDLRQREIKVKSGLFISISTVVGYKYFVGIQMAFCRGQVDALTKIWIGDVEVFSGPEVQDGLIPISERELFGGDELGNGGVVGNFRVHSGSETQTANTYLTGFQTPTAPLRGTMHGVWEGGNLGNSTAIKPWAVEVRRVPNGLGILGGRELVNGFDANPAAVIYELLTDTDWGFGFSPAKVDAANLRTAADTLHAEGNGFSMVLDRARTADVFLKELERQIDGSLYIDPFTGLYKLNLVRGGYDINSIPQLNRTTNVLALRKYAPQTWEETSNQIRVFFDDRSRDYFSTYAAAPDVGNFFIQGQQQVVQELKFPGIKDKTQATNVAAREQRGLGVPLAAATVETDRTLYALVPGDVVAYTDVNLGLTQLPMRVVNIDRGTLLDGKLVIDLIQDVFSFAPSTVAPPDNTLWTAPTQDVDPLPTDEQVIIEAPRGFINRSPDSPGVPDRLWGGGRRQTGFEAQLKFYQRNAVGAPAGDYTLSGQIFGFMQIGQLRTALTGAEAQPTGTVELDPTPDTVADMFASFTQSASPTNVGQNLTNLIMIGDEFMGCSSALDQTSHIDLTTVYRGLLDSVPAAHSIGDDVYLIFVGGGLMSDTIPRGNMVDAQLRPAGRFGEEVTEGAANTVSLTMDDRFRRPYAPTELELNGTRFDDPVNFDTLKSGGSTLDERGVECDYRRRDFRTTDEVQSVLNEASSIDTTFPTANGTEYSLEVIEDPDGTPVSLFTTTYADSASIFASRTKILRENAGVVPSTLRAEVTARHTFEGEVFTSRDSLGWTFDLAASVLDDDTNLGTLNENVISPTYSAPTSGTYTFNLGTALSTGIVEARINGGGWTTIIAATLTTGTLVGVVATDTIEVRHTQGGSDTTETFLEIQAPSSTLDAYAILIV